MKSIKIIQKLLLLITILIAIHIIFSLNFIPQAWLWKFNSIAIFLVMVIRPLADITKIKTLKRVVPLRKEIGILSAVIVLSFAWVNYSSWGLSEFFNTYFLLGHWPFPEPVFWGRLGELVAIPLLLTSNIWSIKKLGKWWKRIQKLSYVYFFAGAYYVYAAFGATEELWFMIIVIGLTITAFIKKRWKRKK